MMRIKTSQFAYWTALSLLAVAFAMVEQTGSAGEAEATVKKVLARKGRRLPAYYRSVVNEKQREAIYKIQEEYQPKIEALQNQLDAIKKERDEKISAVLTAEQRRRVEEAASWAKQKPKNIQPAEPVKEATPAPSEKPKPAE